jgi:hypothetical protein
MYCVQVVGLTHEQRGVSHGLGLNTSCQMPLLIWPPRNGVTFVVEPKGLVECRLTV